MSGGPRLVLDLPPEGGEPDELAEALAELQLLVLRWPVASQALFRSLVQEGRRYQQTADGRALAEELSRSELARRGRLAWEALSLNALDDDPEVTLPSALADAFVQALAEDELEALLVRAFSAGVLEKGAGP